MKMHTGPSNMGLVPRKPVGNSRDSSPIQVTIIIRCMYNISGMW